MTLAQCSGELVTLADRLRQSTVQIQSQSSPAPVHYRGRRFFHRGATSTGSGVIWQADGLIITNAHVISGQTATVELWDGRSLLAQVIRRDAKRDLAALQVNATGLPAVQWGDSDRLRVGEWLFAMGNPLSTVGALTMGILHAVPDDRWLQADIRLAPGNSGGVLANAQGEAIGINSMIVNGLGVAIPSCAVQRWLQPGQEVA
jgi:serine protease Do